MGPKSFVTAGWRVMLTVSLLVLTVLLTLFFYAISWLKHEALNDSQKIAMLVSKEASKTIELYFRDAYTISKVYADNCIIYRQNKISRLNVYHLIKGGLSQNKNFLALWTMWEPNQYDNLDDRFAGDSIHDEKGHFAIAYYYDNGIIKRERNDPSDYYEDFYTTPAKVLKPTIIEPFYYQYHGNPKLYYETSVVYPVVERQKLLGVIGVDIDLRDLNRTIKDLRVFESGIVSVLTNSGHIIAHPDTTLLPIGYIENNQVKTFNKATISQAGQSPYQRTFSVEKDCYVMRFFFPINIEYMTSPWYIMVEVPEDEIYGLADKIKLIIGAIFIAIVFIAYLVLNYIKIQQKRESLNRILFQDSRTALVVMDASNYRFVDCNNAAVQLFGFSRKEEVIGKTPMDVSPSAQEEGDSKTMALAKIQEALAKGSVLFEWQQLKPSGEIWYAEVHLMVMEYWGRKLFQFSLLDITERKKHMDDLLQYRNHLEKMVDKRTAELEIVNEELLTTNQHLFQKNQTLQEQTEELNQALYQLKEAQSRLVQSEKMASLGVLTAGVAHEINNPLNFIAGGAQALESYLAEKGLTNDHDVKVMIDCIKTGIERSTEIVSSLNQFSRTRDNNDDHIDLSNILDNSLVMLKSKLNGKIEFEKNYPNAPIILRGNTGKLHQAFINILYNAIQAIADTGKITIVVKPDANRVKVSITDTGCGIAPDHLPKITDPFFTTKEPGHGTGLGLYITYNIVKEHQGHIHVKSTQGQGTCVTIELPCELKGIHPRA